MVTGTEKKVKKVKKKIRQKSWTSTAPVSVGPRSLRLFEGLFEGMFAGPFQG
jgi:hypothetical protein